MSGPVTYESIVPVAAILVSLVATGLIVLSGRSPNLREGWTLLAGVVKFGLVLTLLPDALTGKAATFTILEIVPGVELALKADTLGVFFALIASALWIVTSIYSIGYMRGNGEARQTRFFAAFALSLSATIGIALSANLLTFLIFYELLTLATYPLVVHKETPEAIRSGRMYLAYALTAGLCFLVATAWIYAVQGNLDFRAGGLLEAGLFSPDAVRGLFVLFMIGVGVKSGLMPLHSWLPAAMVAPTPVSALLHAVAVVKSGVFGATRVVGFVFGPELMASVGLDVILATLAAATVLLASFIAMRQDNLKKRLAYSTVGHLSYIVLGVALLTPAGFTGGMLHMAAHALMKITLFMCAGAIYVHMHKTEVSQLDGMGRAMPWTFGAFAVGALGLAGIPPINGFLSKYYLGLGAVESGQMVFLVVYLISGLLNATYFFPIVLRAFFRDSPDHQHYNEASPWMVVPLCLTAVLAVTFGLFPDLLAPVFTLATNISAEILQTPPVDPS